MSDVLPFVLIAALAAVGALLATGSGAQRAIGIAIAMTAFVAPWLAPREHLLVRALLALSAFACVMRALDLRAGAWPLPQRLAHAFSVVDTRKLLRTAPRLEVLALVRLAGWAGAAALAYVVAWRAGPRATGAVHWLVRWGAGLVFVYAFSEAAYGLLYVGYRLAGFRPPLLHQHPAASRSVQEFWGRRWNLTVSTWLGETFFQPLARRRHPTAGMLLAFFASALVHAYICDAALGLRMAAVMLGYFVAQGVLVGLERALSVARWSPLPGRVWTVAWMVVLSPMFTEALLRVVGV